MGVQTCGRRESDHVANWWMKLWALHHERVAMLLSPNSTSRRLPSGLAKLPPRLLYQLLVDKVRKVGKQEEWSHGSCLLPREMEV